MHQSKELKNAAFVVLNLAVLVGAITLINDTEYPLSYSYMNFQNYNFGSINLALLFHSSYYLLYKILKSVFPTNISSLLKWFKDFQQASYISLFSKIYCSFTFLTLNFL